MLIVQSRGNVTFKRDRYTNNFTNPRPQPPSPYAALAYTQMPRALRSIEPYAPRMQRVR